MNNVRKHIENLVASVLQETIEERANQIFETAKNETAEYYNEHPGSYDIYKPTEMILSYLKNIEQLLTAPK